MLRNSGGTIYSSIIPHSPSFKFDLIIAASLIMNVSTCADGFDCTDVQKQRVDGETGRKEKEIAEDNIHAGPVTGEELKLGTNH